MASAGDAHPFWRLVTTLGILCYVYNHEQLKDFARERGIKLFNLEHLLSIAKGNCMDPEYCKGVRTIDSLIWLKTDSIPNTGYEGRIFFVYGVEHDWFNDLIALGG